MTYAAPLADMRFTLDAVAPLAAEAAELAGAVLEEAAKFAANELAPLNPAGDRVRSVLENGVVRTPAGWPTPTGNMSRQAGTASPPPPSMAARGCRRRSRRRSSRCGTRPTWARRCARCSPRAPSSMLRAHGTEEQKERLPRQDGLGRVDRHHEPHRAAGRLRSRRLAHRAAEPAGRRRATASPARRSSSPTASTT